ncbi:MAG: DUF721 domain-containing protein [Dysgonamonadaceae bacterium]|jgi:predicted nucleic acid-binding Zn ribbon protein|nr:DUF721 domain-containing protein [Dysgonamonadaceae bacterium]
MRRENTQTLKEVIALFLEQNPALSWKLAETRLMGAWKNVLGQPMNHYTTKLFIRNKVLYVTISSSVLKNELMMCREKLIMRLNEEVGKQVITDIVFSG